MATAVLAAPAQGQSFDTLFTSAEEREYLDYLREENLRLSQQNTFNIQEDIIPDIPVVEEVVAAAPPEIIEYRFGGIMERLNGNRMVWLNGRQVAERNLPANISLVTTTAGTLLSIRVDGNIYQLKPGQIFNSRADSIQESFQAGTTAVEQETSPVTPVPEQPTPQSDTREDAPPAQSGTETSSDDASGNAQDASDLGAALEQLNSGNEDLSAEQLQRALEMLTEQANAAE